MRIKLKVETEDGGFTIEREFEPPMTPGGMFGLFGQKVLAQDAPIIEARQVLDVLPTLISAVAAEYADLAARKTHAEQEHDEIREKADGAQVRDLIRTWVREGHDRAPIAKRAREWCETAGIEKISLKECIDIINNEKARIAGEQATEVKSDAEAMLKETNIDGAEPNFVIFDETLPPPAPTNLADIVRKTVAANPKAPRHDIVRAVRAECETLGWDRPKLTEITDLMAEHA